MSDLVVEDQFALRFNKFFQGIKDTSKITRKNVLESLKKDLKLLIEEKSLTNEIVKLLLRQIIQTLNDPIERCRELSMEIITLLYENGALNNEFVSAIIIGLKQRLGQKDLVETSEELRLNLYSLVYLIIEKSDKTLLELHMDEFIAMLKNSILDNYAEIKKKGCACTRLYASKTKQEFHKHSENLIRPLVLNLAHQHSRVRKDMVECVGDVIMFGNNKSVDDVLSHLSQRLFDQVHSVRLSVIQVVGNWLLNMYDRYSYHHKLIPLLLTGFIDEIDEIRETSEALWWDIGIKYEKENEADLKDKLDFSQIKLDYYPPKLERPNLGCRELLKAHLSKILPAILNDIGDWVESTRIKSIQLLYVFIWQSEENLTFNLETVIQTLFKAAGDSEAQVRAKVVECAQLLGYFINPKVTFELLFSGMKKGQSSVASMVTVLNGVIRGYRDDVVYNQLDSICDHLILVHSTVEYSIQREIINSCEAIIHKFECENLEKISKWIDVCGYRLFKLFITALALTSIQDLKDKIHSLIRKILDLTRQQDKNAIYDTYMPLFVDELAKNSDAWNENSYDRLVFNTLILESDLVVDKFVDKIIPIVRSSLIVEKDTETRTKSLILLSQIFIKCDQMNTQNLLKYIEPIINEMLLPNILWKAGRTASAIRLTAVATLITLVQTNFFEKIQLPIETIETILKQMLSTLDDDQKNTRLYSAKIVKILLRLNKGKVSLDELHKMYTELLKRLDDTSEDIRHEALCIFQVYFQNLNSHGTYDKILYQSHLQVLYQGLLIHLDDSNPLIQQNVCDILKTDAKCLDSDLLREEINKVKGKHRSDKYCNQILNSI